MYGIVDPRPAQNAALKAKQAEIDAASDDAERERLRGELEEMKKAWGHSGGLLRRVFLGWAHRSVPW
jgi:hypothetical protein